ncbi:MAG: hypothetical protein EOO10_20065, partial [Chitinophagaceae bacterium]
MEKVAVRKKLQLRYTLPATLADLFNEFEELRLFTSYYHLDADTLLSDAEANLLNRLAIYAQSPAAPPDALELAPVIEGAKNPETAAEQWVSNIQRAIDFLADKNNEKLNLDLLSQAHKVLVYKLP